VVAGVGFEPTIPRPQDYEPDSPDRVKVNQRLSNSSQS
jgi:hypothetical protein